MSALDRLLIGCILAAALLVGGVLGVRHYGAERFEAGRTAAIAAGEKLRQAEAERNHETESDLRAKLAAADANAFKKEQKYASNLEAAQRRVRAGVDSLRCPASTVQPGAAAGDRPAAGGHDPDREGPAMVPDVSAVVLGLVADHQRLVQRYARVVERFEACRAVNAQP